MAMIWCRGRRPRSPRGGSRRWRARSCGARAARPGAADGRRETPRGRARGPRADAPTEVRHIAKEHAEHRFARAGRELNPHRADVATVVGDHIPEEAAVGVVAIRARWHRGACATCARPQRASTGQCSLGRRPRRAGVRRPRLPHPTHRGWAASAATSSCRDALEGQPDPHVSRSPGDTPPHRRPGDSQSPDRSCSTSGWRGRCRDSTERTPRREAAG